ncbi:MAG TPA: hypothetical protein VII06_24060 [Chloroflexota bacterium]|jgi:hypothetical protein
MGAQVAVPMAAGVVLAAALILAGLGRWLAYTRPSQQRLTRFAPPAPAAVADAPVPRAADGASARLARLLDAHPGTLATGALAVLALAAGLLAHAPEVSLVAAVALALLALRQFSRESTRPREHLEEQL